MHPSLRSPAARALRVARVAHRLLRVQLVSGVALATAVASPLAAQFDGCTWARCAAQVVPGWGTTRVAFGSDTIALGWRGREVATRLARAGDAAPHAARMTAYRTRGIPLAIAGTLATPFVLAAILPDRRERTSDDAYDASFGVAILGGTLVSTLGDIETVRSARELHHAVWRHNRQLAAAIRRTPADSLAAPLRGCTIEQCGVRMRYRGALGGIRLVQGDAGAQVDLSPWNARAVLPLFRGSAEAQRDVEQWASNGRSATMWALATAVGSIGWFFAQRDASPATRVWGAVGIAAAGGLAVRPFALESERALQRAIWRVNGELAR